MNRKIISLGVGVQSTYIVLAATKEYRIDPIYQDWKDAIIIFADTGSEKKETIEYFHNILEPILKRNNKEYYVVKSPDFPLYNFFLAKNKIPTRMYRDCTNRFKTTPIIDKIKELFPDVSHKNPVYQALGITKDEVHRMKPNKRKYIVNEFPIVHLTRDEVIAQYSDWGLPVPVKSGCWLCPFANLSDMKKFNDEQWEKLTILEENARRHDKNPEKMDLYLFQGKPISYWETRMTRLRDIKTTKLDDFFQMDECSGRDFI